MEKINFINGQEPYINDTNLNQLQDNMEAVSVPSRRNSRTNTIKSK